MLYEKLQKMGLARNSLEGKVAVVTGAGRGIGKELARALAWMGARVVIAEISDSGRDVMTQIRSEGGAALFVRTDVSDERSVGLLSEEAVHEFGPVDVLVNNAVVSPTGKVHETPVETWDAVYAVNVRGAVMTTRAFLRGMMDRRQGVIVNVSSAEGMPFAGAYSASKSALRSMALSLAAELGEASGISVFVFEPGMVDTPGGVALFQQMARGLGLTYEQFVAQGLNEGYAGLMPVEDCAAGLAHAIANAREHHGGSTSPSRPLAEAELLETGARAKKTRPRQPTAAPPPSVILPQLTEEFRDMMEKLAAEIDQSQFLARAAERYELHAGTGLTIGQWLEDARELSSDVNGDIGLELSTGMRLVPHLRSLGEYLSGSEQGIRERLKDPVRQKKALDTLARQTEIIGSLVEAIEAGVPGKGL